MLSSIRLGRDQSQPLTLPPAADLVDVAADETDDSPLTAERPKFTG